ncbi:aminotransferase class IV [Tundrisphaera lichenicola]|uniref:aminotransferase class IV n=1 Tax=Tundrisphaera lichenicola TaxID=2029860 RepID=UPI003EBA523B
MIWSAGEILPDDGLKINAADRTFEHGLGLFETMRTWARRPVFLASHRSRMLKSAKLLHLRIDPSQLPSEQDVARLLEADGVVEDQILRMTASGGTESGSTVWMRSRPLTGLLTSPIRLELGSWTIHHDDPLARHKSLNYWVRRMALFHANTLGFDETLGLSEPGLYCEGSISNLFVVQDGAILTATLDSPIIPGLMRGFVLELAREIDLSTLEVPGFLGSSIRASDEVFLTNSVRGIVPVARIEDQQSDLFREWPGVGPLTRLLQIRLSERLLPGDTLP